MKLIIFILLAFIFSNCSKPKTVLICGDHVCVNKAEAEQYFEENLSIEVKIVGKKLNIEEDLVELNLKENSLGNKKISISSKKTTNNPIKRLSNEEVVKIKENIKNKMYKITATPIRMRIPGILSIKFCSNIVLPI